MSGSTSTPPSYTAALTGYSMVSLIQGDTIEQVAYRTLGDAAQWRVLVAVNGLIWPYLTDDPTQASATVLLTTSKIKVPAASPAEASGVTDDTIFGTDLLLQGGQLQVANGDLLVVSGVPNLVAALIRRLQVVAGSLPYWPNYGSLVATLIGKGGGPAAVQRAAAYAAACINADSRISSCTTTATIAGTDAITVSGQAVTVDGKVLPTGQINVSN